MIDAEPDFAICPNCVRPITLSDDVFVDDEVNSGIISCPDCGWEGNFPREIGRFAIHGELEDFGYEVNDE